LCLQLLGARVGRLLEQSDARLAPELLAVEERRIRPDGDLDARDRLRGVPVPRERLGRDVLVQLDTRARGLGRNRVRMRGELLDAGNRDLQVLSARGEDLLVEQLVARIRAERLGAQVLLADRREDPDDHHVRADGACTLLRVVEAGARLALELVEHVRPEKARMDVDLDVELSELGLEVGVCDRLQHGSVHHCRVGVLVGQVQLDLESDRAARRLELRFGQHAREYLQARVHLAAIALAILAREGLCGDLFTHGVLASDATYPETEL
jgi:hypothetical protein